MWKLEEVAVVPTVMGVIGEVPRKVFRSLNILGIEKKMYPHKQKSTLLDAGAILRSIKGNR